MNKLYIIILSVLIALSVSAQTNTTSTNSFKEFFSTNSFLTATNIYYRPGEFTVELAPTLTSSSLFSSNSKHTYGGSFEMEYWQTACTGTGIEIGTYDVLNNNHGIDHLAIMEDFRVVPVPNVVLLNRLALVAKVGVETYLNDGNKNVEIGFGIDYQIYKNIRTEASFMQHFGNSSDEGGSTIRVGLQWMF